MKSYSPEPLTPEEREMARLTGHLGPQAEPSTALDARILAAAHAALERKQPARRKPRWPVALGLAASVVFAVGIAWQLRPLQQTPMAASSEAPVATAEQEAVADSAVALPQADLAEAPASTKSVSADPAQIEQAPPAPAKALMAPPPSPELRAQQPRQLARSAKTSEPRRQAQPAGNIGADSTPPPPPTPPASAIMTAAPAPADDASIPFAPDPLEGYSAYAAADSPTANMSAAAAKPQADALAEAKAARTAASARHRESASLERVEVTGSRMKRTDLQVPVSDDAQLPVTEWLERVRTRYGLGDAGAAKQSLLLFVKDHPSEPVPDDLEPLLEK